MCRYLSPNGAIVDLMPTDPTILGFSGRWYPRVVETATSHALSNGRSILIPTPALLFACKLEAFTDRGAKDPWLSKDLEDIAALLDGCPALFDDVRAQDDDLRRFVADGLQAIEQSQHNAEALRAQLPRGGDEDGQLRRIGRLIDLLIDRG